MTRSLPVLLEGDGFIAVAKPSGMLVHRNRFNPRADAALQRVRDQVGCMVYPIHRLDGATSGCLLFATERLMAGPLSAALSAGRKRYVALVRGVAKGPQSVVVSRPLKDDNGIEKTAVTALDALVVCADPPCSLILACPQTGRYHQIRRHLRGLSHPIIGDRAHGDSHINRAWRARGITRLALHCLSIELTVAGQELTIRCPLPADLAQPMAALPLWPAACTLLPELGAVGAGAR